MVPLSYKAFLVLVGALIGGSYTYVSLSYKTSLTFENPSITMVQVVEAKTEEVKKVEILEKAEFSAYTASVNETDSNPLVMASGKMVYIGAVACPRDIPLGTKIEVKGLGTYTCEDRMNSRYTNNFDIFMLTKKEALTFGRQSLEYQIIK